jgi:hypothetical protein
MTIEQPQITLYVEVFFTLILTSYISIMLSKRKAPPLPNDSTKARSQESHDCPNLWCEHQFLTSYHLKIYLAKTTACTDALLARFDNKGLSLDVAPCQDLVEVDEQSCNGFQPDSEGDEENKP